jgi:pyridoxine 5'-phosphate synthase PdxJ
VGSADVDPDSPLKLYCDISALDPAQRARRAELAKIVRANTVRVTEDARGFTLHLRRDDAVIRQAEELIGLERRCCAFLALDLRRDAATGDTVLDVMGGEGAKAFIAAEMDLLDGREG